MKKNIVLPILGLIFLFVAIIISNSFELVSKHVSQIHIHELYMIIICEMIWGVLAHLLTRKIIESIKSVIVFALCFIVTALLLLITGAFIQDLTIIEAFSSVVAFLIVYALDTAFLKKETQMQRKMSISILVSTGFVLLGWFLFYIISSCVKIGVAWGVAYMLAAVLLGILGYGFLKKIVGMEIGKCGLMFIATTFFYNLIAGETIDSIGTTVYGIDSLWLGLLSAGVFGSILVFLIVYGISMVIKLSSSLSYKMNS